jgi:hypothetical protein
MLWEHCMRNDPNWVQECVSLAQYDLDVRTLAQVNANLFPSGVAQGFSDPSPTNPPETSKEITMTQTCQFDASVPVLDVTLVYGLPVKGYSDKDMLDAIQKLDAAIATYGSVLGSERLTKKVEALKAEREAIIKAFDAAA